MSSCGSSSCSCGSGSTCGSGCTCKSYSGEMASVGGLISGVAPFKTVFERSVKKSVEGDGCGCGDDCSCDPCTC